MQLDHSW